ncbi:unnamed protein product [Phytophthora lilii]|uniref:Unnamed protein product n=1 Tax=Phytophthora lilii TaxID=2077276 RepID=A0A9W6WT70_9STRA|nr:unnamed protein product [Phytophthora lilii]
MDARNLQNEVGDGSDDNVGTLISLVEDELDPHLLLDALDGDIEDFPAESSTVTRQSLDSNSTRGTQGPGKVRRKKNKNKARDDRRFLLIQLHDEVERLEFTLQQLQIMRNKRPRVDNCSKGGEHNNEVPAVWQDICARQLQRRLNAERENIRLKQQFKNEKELAKSIAKLLYTRRNPKSPGPDAKKHTRRTDIPAGYIEQMTAFIFDELSTRLETLCSHVDDVLEVNGSFPVTRRPLFSGGAVGNEDKFIDKRCLSFNVLETGEAWWRSWHEHRGRDVHETVGDTVVERFEIEMNESNANTSVSGYGQQILRRQVESHRTMFVWNAYLEPFVFENEHVSGIYFLEQCHVIIQPERQGRPSACMTTCYSITPFFLDPKMRDNSKAGELIEFFVSSLFATMKERSEMVENLLLDQAVQMIRNGSAEASATTHDY